MALFQLVRYPITTDLQQKAFKKFKDLTEPIKIKEISNTIEMLIWDCEQADISAWEKASGD